MGFFFNIEEASAKIILQLHTTLNRYSSRARVFVFGLARICAERVKLACGLGQYNKISATPIQCSGIRRTASRARRARSCSAACKLMRNILTRDENFLPPLICITEIALPLLFAPPPGYIYFSIVLVPRGRSHFIYYWS